MEGYGRKAVFARERQGKHTVRRCAFSGKHARKIQQLQTNPNVCWVFTNAHFADVVTLYGQARVIDSPIVSQHVFDRLMDTARTYVMGALADESNLEFVALETLVQKVEYYSPRQKLYQPQVVDLQNA